EAVRTLRRQVLAQAQPLEQRDGVAREDFTRWLARIEREQNGDEPAYDVGIAVAHECQHRSAFAVGLHARREPDLARTPLYLVGFGPCRFRQRLEFPAKLDDIAIAVVPVI